MIGRVSSDAHRLAAEFTFHSVDAPKRVRKVVRTWGRRLQTKVKANATTGHHAPGQPHIPGTGPGPNVATGDYRRGIGLEFLSSPESDTAIVGTNSVQGYTLENGREPHWPPYPHFGPALDWVEEPFLRDLDVAVYPDVLRPQ